MKQTIYGLIVLIIAFTTLLLVKLYQSDIIIEDEMVPEGIVYTLSDETMVAIDTIRIIEDEITIMTKSTDTELINNATMAFIRSKRYGYRTEGFERIIWNAFAGDFYDETGLSLSDNKEAIDKIIGLADKLDYISDNETDVVIDFPHMVAVMDVIYTDTARSDHEETYYDYMLSWGGDLETFLMDVSEAVETSDQNKYEGYYTYAMETIGSTSQSHFSEEDYYANIDGLNVVSIMKRDKSRLSEALEFYYSKGLFIDRESIYIDEFGGPNAFEARVRCFMLGEIEAAYVGDEDFIQMMDSLEGYKVLMFKYMSGKKDSPDPELKEAVTMAYIDKLLGYNIY